jgi:hypothetical protein
VNIMRTSLATLGLAVLLYAAPSEAADEATFCSFTGATALMPVHGNAAYVGSSLRVVPNLANQAGSAYLATPIPITASTSFHTHFRFTFAPNGAATGGEGITFVIQNAGPTAVGGFGGSLGYGGGVFPSIAVEFDTAMSAGTNDPDGNHIGLHLHDVSGVMTSHLAFASAGVPAMDGAGPLDAWIDYDGSTNQIQVFMSTTTVKPGAALLTYTGLDLSLVGTQGYVGFTGGTGAVGTATNNEDILYWTFTTGSTLNECVPCTTQPQCTNAVFPVCDTTRAQCVSCTSNNGVAGFACPTTTAPVCQTSGSITGQCTQCSSANVGQCGGASTTPTCDATIGSCAGCTGDNATVTARPCLTTAARACQVTGACTQCSPTNVSACTPAAPTCNAAGTCAACTGDQGAGGTNACPSSTLPACQTDGTCTQCSATRMSLCTGATPTCGTVSGTCGACNGDRGSGATFACPNVFAPACQPNGTCAACSATNRVLCNGATPTCDTTTALCAGCNGDNGGVTNRTCPSGAAPACRASGECTPCSATNISLCSGTTPTCNTASGNCAGCDGDNGSGAVRACTTSANPFCVALGSLTGSCDKCTSSTDCIGHPLGSVCNTTNGACGTSCADDTNCTANQWCSGNVCTTKTANGQAVPAAAGTCSVATGARTCLSGVCETADNLCGLKNGKSCANDAGASPLTCRSAICFPGDNLCGRPDKELCSVGADCRSAKCDTNVCVSCTSDTECGDTQSGKVCGDEKKCADGCRGIGGNTCTPPLVCTSRSGSVGTCTTPVEDAGPDVVTIEDAGEIDAGQADAGQADAGFDAGPPPDEARLAGSGLTCAASPGSGGGTIAVVALGALTASLASRRRRRRRP